MAPGGTWSRFYHLHCRKHCHSNTYQGKPISLKSAKSQASTSCGWDGSILLGGGTGAHRGQVGERCNDAAQTGTHGRGSATGARGLLPGLEDTGLHERQRPPLAVQVAASRALRPLARQPYRHVLDGAPPCRPAVEVRTFHLRDSQWSRTATRRLVGFSSKPLTSIRSLFSRVLGCSRASAASTVQLALGGAMGASAPARQQSAHASGSTQRSFPRLGLLRHTLEVRPKPLRAGQPERFRLRVGRDSLGLLA